MKVILKQSYLNGCFLLFLLLFWGVSILRHQLYQRKILDSYRSSVPVIIVGNLSVGEMAKHQS